MFLGGSNLDCWSKSLLGLLLSAAFFQLRGRGDLNKILVPLGSSIAAAFNLRSISVPICLLWVTPPPDWKTRVSIPYKHVAQSLQGPDTSVVYQGLNLISKAIQNGFALFLLSTKAILKELSLMQEIIMDGLHFYLLAKMDTKMLSNCSWNIRKVLS